MYDGGGALLGRGSKPLITVRDVWMLSGWMGRYWERALWRWNRGEGDCGCASGMLLKKRKKFLRDTLFKTYRNLVFSQVMG